MYSTGLRSQVRAVVDRGIDGAGLHEHRRWIIEAFLSEALASTDLERYCSSESLNHLAYEEATWKKRLDLCMVPTTAREPVLSTVQAIYEELRSAGGVVDVWRTLEIPLDLPALNVRPFWTLPRCALALSRSRSPRLGCRSSTWSRSPLPCRVPKSASSSPQPSLSAPHFAGPARPSQTPHQSASPTPSSPTRANGSSAAVQRANGSRRTAKRSSSSSGLSRFPQQPSSFLRSSYSPYKTARRRTSSSVARRST